MRGSQNSTLFRLSVRAAVAVMMLFIACATSKPALNEEEWKSLSNPQSRMLFFKILQSYFSGRELDPPSASRSNVLEGLDRYAADVFFQPRGHSSQNSNNNNVDD
ncbi:hypothetical protein GN956_G9610 [Arapaima gigas]